MFIDRPAAEIDPSCAMRSSSVTLPGPSRPSWSKSILMLRCGIARLLTAFERDALDHGVDRPPRRKRQALHRLGCEAGRQHGAIAIETDVSLRARWRDLGDLSRQHVQ